MAFKASTVIKAIGNPALKELVAGEGYWYFIYDGDGDYDTKSIYTMRLSDMPLERWVAEGREFVAKMEATKTYERKTLSFALQLAKELLEKSDREVRLVKMEAAGSDATYYRIIQI